MSDAMAQENAVLRAELDHLRRFVEALEDITEQAASFSSSRQVLPLLDNILLRAMAVTGAQVGVVALLDIDKDELMFALVHGDLKGSLTGFTMPADQGILGWVVQNRQAVLVPDAQADPRFSRAVDEDFAFTTRSVVAAPLLGDQRVLGAVEVLHTDDTVFTAQHLRLLRLTCHVAGEALANVERLG